MRHVYERDTQSGAGNCRICHDAEHTTKHPHVFRLAWKQPIRPGLPVCTCGEPAHHETHVLVPVHA